MQDGFICGVVFVAGFCMGTMIEASGQDTAENELCQGKPKIVQTTDTIRTFTCTVELKK